MAELVDAQVSDACIARCGVQVPLAAPILIILMSVNIKEIGENYAQS